MHDTSPTPRLLAPALWQTLVALSLAAALIGCSGPSDSGGPEPDPEPGAIFAPLGEAVPFASAEQREIFLRGQAVASRRFTPEEGLGPSFNLVSCAGCHEKPVLGGSAPRYRNFQLVGRELSDGSRVTLGVNGIQTQYRLEDGRPTYQPMQVEANHLATRNSIPFFGVGLLAEIPEEEILQRADPSDRDGDGISGRPNWDRGFVGRFGLKAQTVSIEGFIRGPLFNHLGLTSNPLSPELKAALPVPSAVDSGELVARSDGLGLQPKQAAAPDEPTVDDDGVPDPELSEQDLFDVVAFSMLLAPPPPDAPTPESERGRALFAQSGCASCHVPALHGPRGAVPAYTDLLLHDMGADLDDGVLMGEATGSEFRTAPLWGVAAIGPYLHDGRADTLDEAIRWHDGEGRAAREAYEGMTAEEQASMIAFLESLGGAELRSAGLLHPETPLAAPRELGGPTRALAADDAARFARGRELFDADARMSEGLGPLFNGDSCRACHFDPVLGGAGPLGLNVMRQGIVAEDVFTAPELGTVLHRFNARLDARNLPETDANVFEGRQSPPLFGMGLIDAIPEATVLERDDPSDEDGDGISGRCHVLPDGRVGRFGWKADVPDLEEFMRDALTTEVGLTVPQREGRSFGRSSDVDDAADPEFADADYDAMLFYMRELAPPPRQRTDVALEDHGEQLFAQIGCDSCHVPTLMTGDGEPVHLYSDLLLHEVLDAPEVGIESGAASMREFRTPPLWGVSQTAPFLHSGAATTLEEAIAEHGAEGSASRSAYEQLSEAEREALLAFLRSL